MFNELKFCQVEDETAAGKLMSYVISMIVQILVPCYFGNELIVASEKLSVSLFHSNWIDASSEHKHAMRIFMANAGNPMKLSAFGIFELKMENFMLIINSAYSAFAVLKNVKANY